jgi:Fic family protein
LNFEKIDRKKAELDVFRKDEKSLPAVMARNLEDWFRIELTYTSNAIEANTLTRQETALVVEKGLTVGGKTLQEHLEATNHAKALDWVRELAERRKGKISEHELLEIHRLILKGIDDDNAGCYRTVPVRISGSEVILPNPRKVPDLMEDFGKWLTKAKMEHPVHFAAEAHYQLVTIHPYADGNGRTGRLLMNLILMMHGFPPAIIRKRDRLGYLNALETAELGGPKDKFYELILKSVERSLDVYLKAIKGIDETAPQKQKLLKIGQVAKEVGESVQTIRFWTQQGLLTIADKTPSNYSLYETEVIARVKRIQELKQERYTLKEILKLLS